MTANETPHGKHREPLPDLFEIEDSDWQLHLPTEPVDPPFPLVSQRNRDELEQFGPLMEQDYEDFKENLITWLSAVGKTPKKGEGLADTTLHNTHYKLEVVFRWLWRTKEEYTTELTPDDADAFMGMMVNFSDKQESSLTHYSKALKRYFRYLNHTRGTQHDWTCKEELSQTPGKERTYLKRRYFEPLYQAALDYGSVKSYTNNAMTPDERDRIKIYLAQRLGIPKADVGPEEFREATSWKIPSLMAMTLDCGLRPIEVGRVKAEWVNLDDHELQVPKEGSTKNEEYWNCSLKHRTVKALRRWMEERATYNEYRDSDLLWLTKKQTPYGTGSCNRLLRRLMDRSEATFPDDITWYSIRHGVATMWANHVGVHHAKEQLRHKSVHTTMKYLHSDSETRRKAIEQLW